MDLAEKVGVTPTKDEAFDLSIGKVSKSLAAKISAKQKADFDKQQAFGDPDPGPVGDAMSLGQMQSQDPAETGAGPDVQSTSEMQSQDPAETGAGGQDTSTGQDEDEGDPETGLS